MGYIVSLTNFFENRDSSSSIFNEVEASKRKSWTSIKHLTGIGITFPKFFLIFFNILSEHIRGIGYFMLSEV